MSNERFIICGGLRTPRKAAGARAVPLSLHGKDSNIALRVGDISQKMLDVAAERVGRYEGELTVQQMDVHDMPFEDGHFDQVFTSCTFCSVPNPVSGLEALRRVLKPGGDLYMFEHTGSRYYPFKLMMDLMTPLSRKLGPEMNRPTVENVRAAGYQLEKVEHVYLDVVKTIHATA